jgi:hypothetical protein
VSGRNPEQKILTLIDAILDLLLREHFAERTQNIIFFWLLVGEAAYSTKIFFLALYFKGMR